MTEGRRLDREDAKINTVSMTTVDANFLEWTSDEEGNRKRV